MRKRLNEGIKIVLVALALVAIASSLTYLFYRYVAVEKIIEYNTYLIVSDHAGFDVNKSYIHFGMLKPGESSSKNMLITNSGNESFKLQIKVSGNFMDWITVDLGKSRIISPGESRKIFFIADVPTNASYGNYTGKIAIIFRRF